MVLSVFMTEFFRMKMNVDLCKPPAALYTCRLPYAALLLSSASVHILPSKYTAASYFDYPHNSLIKYLLSNTEELKA